MTPDEMLTHWRTLLAASHKVNFDLAEYAEEGITCTITIYHQDSVGVEYEGADPDPLRAFEQAWTAAKASGE